MHTTMPDEGAPYTLVSLPQFLLDEEDARDGDWSGGGRVYGTIGPVGFTLNYLYAYWQDGIFRDTGEIIWNCPTGMPIIPGELQPCAKVQWEHPKVNIYGASFNYYVEPLVSILRGEIIVIPDHPYEDLASNNSKIAEKLTCKYVIGLDRPTWFFPKRWTPHTANFGLQFYQNIRSGDTDDIAINTSSVDSTDEGITIYIDQPFRHDTVNVYGFYNYDFKGAYWFTSGVKYKPGNTWAAEVFYTTTGGSDDRLYKLGALEWVESVLVRLTYYFD